MLVSGAIVGTALGFAIGRDLSPLARVSINWLPVLIVSVCLRLAAPVIVGWTLPMEVMAMFATAMVALLNVRLPGMALVAIGAALNFFTVLANSGMPVDFAGLAAIGVSVPSDGLHRPETAATMFAALGDVLVIGPLRAAYSVGDAAIAIGAFLVPFLTLVRR